MSRVQRTHNRKMVVIQFKSYFLPVNDPCQHYNLSPLSLLQKTLKIRPKTRLVNPSYPPHIWHQQSMDPKFVEKGLTPIDLMTVKKKLEVLMMTLINFLYHFGSSQMITSKYPYRPG